MRRNLTSTVVASLKAPEKGRQVDVWDSRQPGFGIRISYGGVKTWQIMYRVHGVKHRYVLGRHPEMGLSDARQAARSKLGQIADGGDPAQERADQRSEPTFAQIAEEYLNRHAVSKRPRGRQEDVKMLRNDLLPAWGNWQVSEIKRRHIVALLDAIVDRGAPIQANRTKSLVSTIFRFAEDRELIDYNPAVRLRAPAPKQERTRTLSEDELRRLFVVLEDEPPRRQAIVRVALLTAARKSEILGMTRGEIDGDWWTLPGGRTKNKREHRLPLVPSVLAAIEELPRDGEFVFHGRKQLGQASSRTCDWFPQVCERAGIEGVVFHDLRRTASTMLNKLRVKSIIVERILNHIQGGVAGIYNRYEFDREKRAALLRWEKRLDEIIAGQTGASNVIALHG
jgi:integrase